ncbi:putative thiosulfate sulfurtransferase, mitochondrial isoform X2 [Spodoptera litura]|uniref:Thiosulfate sulfurtransferase, mitochondrial isoform X2 n=2 Tax=Spodoptera litura TaxID=69820 RepID=A0A9J7E6H1_SPOLT|nr:putative thiosulfate sulfurtransferase, mitochondrial isoform X2 [Spodoptera litura]
MLSFHYSLRPIITTMKSQLNACLLFDRKFILYTKRTYSEKETLESTMVDPKRVVSYDDMLKIIYQPEKMIIDVREPEEIQSTGQIPSSINIPLKSVHEALDCMSEEDFRCQYCREKPALSDELIFYCKTGRRSTIALNQALKLGYVNSKNYLGSWTEWSQKSKLH